MYTFLCYVYNKAFKENSYRFSTASDFKRKKITHTIQKYKKIFFRTYKLKSLSGQSFSKKNPTKQKKHFKMHFPFCTRRFKFSMKKGFRGRMYAIHVLNSTTNSRLKLI